MPRSHTAPVKPTPLLALVALALLHRYRPGWVAIGVAEAARHEELSAQRISRLSTAALQPFETALGVLTRRGRPPLEPGLAAQHSEHEITAALLAVASELLSKARPSRRGLRAFIVGAWMRLSQAHPSLTKKHFCQTLALSTRTLRSWLSEGLPHDAAPLPSAPSPKPRPPRPPRRRRFDFDLTLPDTQLAADTTDLSAFGIPLKLIASQDVGGRDQDLFDAVVVDESESAEHVVRVLTQTLADNPGMQAITDQGTPYMAKLTAEVLEALDTEHAPQKEADPTGKATVERAFATLKSIAAPLLGLTDCLADALPQLRMPVLATALSRILLAALLRAYQHGARAARRAQQQRGGIDPDTLAELAQHNREQAQARERSARLLLEHIHALYDINGPCARFVKLLRSYPIEVLQQAEQALRTQVHRDNIVNRKAYFAAIVRRHYDAWKLRREFQRRETLQRASRKADDDQHRAELDARRRHPATWLLDALIAISAHWLPTESSLLFDGIGAGTAWLRGAWGRLVELHGAHVATDIARGVFADFRLKHLPHLGPSAIDAVHLVFLRELEFDAVPDPATEFAVPTVSDILRSYGQNQRPPPPQPLRI